jgi:hypothetical protein
MVPGAVVGVGTGVLVGVEVLVGVAVVVPTGVLVGVAVETGVFVGVVDVVGVLVGVAAAVGRDLGSIDPRKRTARMRADRTMCDLDRPCCVPRLARRASSEILPLRGVT